MNHSSVARPGRTCALISVVLLAGIGLSSTRAGGAIITVSGADHRAQAPEVAVGADGSINLVWLDENQMQDHDHGEHGHSHRSATNLYFSRSVDGGRSFSEPVRINEKNGDVWGFSVSKPRVVVGRRGVIHVFYPANDVNPVNGKPEAVALYTRSTDGGRSFEKPRRLNSMGQTDASDFVHGGLTHAHVFGTLAAGRDGAVYAMWIDTRDMKSPKDHGKVFIAVSRDDGRSWSGDRELFPADVCPCCQLTAFVDARNRLYVGSRQVVDGYRDSTIAISTDGGRTFSARQRIVGGRWKIDACPLKPTAVAAQGREVYAAYYSAGETPNGVYFVRSTDEGRSWSKPMLVHEGAAVSDAPSVVLAGNRLHLVWQAKAGGPRRIFTRSSTDGGASFGPVTEVPMPEGAVQWPAVAAHADGSLQLVWQHDTVIRTARLPMPDTNARVAAH